MHILRADGSTLGLDEAFNAWKKELEDDMEPGETLEERMLAWTFENWLEGLTGTGDFEIVQNGLEKEINLKKSVESDLIIHCPNRRQAELLIAGTEVPDGNTKLEAILGWDKYADKTVYALTWQPSYPKVTLVWFSSINDKGLEGEKIIKYDDLEDLY